jgi:hypothetical protein
MAGRKVEHEGLPLGASSQSRKGLLTWVLVTDKEGQRIKPIANLIRLIARRMGYSGLHRPRGPIGVSPQEKSQEPFYRQLRLLIECTIILIELLFASSDRILYHKHIMNPSFRNLRRHHRILPQSPHPTLHPPLQHQGTQAHRHHCHRPYHHRVHYSVPEQAQAHDP